MTSPPTRLILLAIIVVVCGGTLLFLRGPSPEPEPPTSPGKPHRKPAATRSLARGTARSEADLLAIIARNPSPPAPEIPAASLSISSTDRIREAFQNLPTDARTGAAERMVQAVADERYAVLIPLLKDSRMPPEVLNVLMADVLDRPDSLALPIVLEVAQVPGHPEAEDALDILKLYLEKDHGADWNQWRRDLEAWLKENPD